MSKPKPLAIGIVKPAEAIASAQGRGVVLPDIYYGQLQGIERAEAFSVAGIAKIDQLQQTLDSLTEALDQGMSFDQWKTQALKAPDVLALPNHRLDNIFRTNLQGAYARGKCAHIEANRDTRPFLMYSAINDARTRPAHAAMSGHTAPIDDPVWKRWTPPCGYRCRCTVISLSKAQGEARRNKDNQALLNNPDRAQARSAAIDGGPDEGWGYSPCENPNAGVTAAIADRKNRLHAALLPKLEKLQEAAKLIASLDDFSQWTRLEDRKGSNPGGLYQDPAGVKWYVKQYADPKQAKTEIAAQGLYKLAGLDTPELKLVTDHGKTYLASRWLDLAHPTAAQMAKHHAPELARIYATSALVKNWDVVGQSLDNIALNTAGKLVVIDAGGSFTFRAQGKLKEFIAGPVDELATMADPTRTAGKVFSQLPEAKRLAAIRALEGMTKTSIRAAFDAAGFDAKDAAKLTDATWGRRKWMLETVRNRKAQVVKVGTKYTPAEAAKILEAKKFGELTTYSSPAQTMRAWQVSHGWSDDDTPYFSAIKVYTGGAYKRINNHLRAADGTMDAVAAIINEGLARQAKYYGVVGRGARYEIDPAWIGLHKQALAEGKAVQYRGFSSTDTKGGWKKNVILRIEAKGLQGVYVDRYSLNSGESEVLFPHLARFRVKAVTEPKGSGKVYIDLVEDEAAFGLEAITLQALA